MADDIAEEPLDLRGGACRQRADGRVSISTAYLGGASRVVRIAEAGSARVRLPRHHGGPVEAVLINTGGGIASGDRFATDAEIGSGADLTLTSAAAEKIYRSEGQEAAIRTTIRVASGGSAEWLPQETILYDRARLRRSLEVDVASDGCALLFEASVFGREAHGETVRAGSFEDRWRVRREGRLVYADTFRIAGEIAGRLAHPAIANGRRALATLLYVAPDAEARRDEARDHLAGAAGECGASAWNGILMVRWLAPDIATLRADASRFMTAFRGRPLPRVWHL